MDSDLLLIAGLVAGLLSVPAMISAFSGGRPPRAAMVAATIGGALVLVAITTRPEGYRAQDIPEIALSVIARYLR